MQLTELFRAKYRKDNNAYTVIASPFNDNLNHLLFKFDSGASYTIVSLAALIPTYSKDFSQRDKIAKQLENSHYIKRDLKSASGHNMTGILCHVTKIQIAGYFLDHFWFYLVPDYEHPKALLGVDFIACCKFEAEIKRDIIVTRFSKSHYETSYQFKEKKKLLDIDSIDFSDFIIESKKI